MADAEVRALPTLPSHLTPSPQKKEASPARDRTYV